MPRVSPATMPPVYRPYARGITARVEVDAIDQRRMDDARAEREVVEQRHADAVDEVAGVPGRSAAHEEERQAADDRRDAGHHVDRAEGVAECARQVAYVLFRHARAADFLAHAAHVDVLDAGNRRWLAHRRAYALDVRDDWRRRRRLLVERDLDAHARADGASVARRRLEPERRRSGLHDGEKRLGARQDAPRHHDAVRADDHLEHDDRVAPTARRILHGHVARTRPNDVLVRPRSARDEQHRDRDERRPSDHARDAVNSARTRSRSAPSTTSSIAVRAIAFAARIAVSTPRSLAAAFANSRAGDRASSFPRRRSPS